MIRIVLSVVLGAINLLMIAQGAAFFSGTLGVVNSSELGMLISITNLLAMIVVWLGVYGLRELTSKTEA